MRPPVAWLVPALSFGIAVLSGSCEDEPAVSRALSRPRAYARARALAALGQKMFSDPSLSASGAISCASCHSPTAAYGPPNARSTQPGGLDLRQSGIRAVPSLMYLQAAPQFAEHYFESDDQGDGSVDNGPTGGLTWDGRVDRARDQARLPLLSSREMANDSAEAVVAKVRTSTYARELEQLVADRAGADTDPFETILQAFEAFQQDAARFYPYSSKYDAFLAGEADLSVQERRGLQLFEDPAKGNCASCHRSRRSKSGALPQFTDYGLIALGVPRNPDIPANANLSWFDLGACGPERLDLRGRSEYCGRFMTPTLRNVATRRTFFHNGVFHSLKDAIAFYAQRDSHPQQWYPREADGRVSKFDDLPVAYQHNVNMDPPFGRAQGDTPALSDREIDDVMAFLETLTDGYRCALTRRPREPAARSVR